MGSIELNEADRPGNARPSPWQLLPESTCPACIRGKEVMSCMAVWHMEPSDGSWDPIEVICTVERARRLRRLRVVG